MIELALVTFITFAGEVVIGMANLYPLYKEWNFVVLSSSLRPFLSHGVNSRIAIQANPQFTVRDTYLMDPAEAIKLASPPGQSRANTV